LKYYNNNDIDVLVNVSHSEGIPVSMMEAQSCGIPVCAKNVGGVPEIVDNDNGVLLSEDVKPAGLAESLILFSNPDYRNKKSELSRRNWKWNFDAEKNYTEFAKRIKNL
jgi:colanic acid/amylovoran biosynthesis glycosyltransferase